MDTSSFRRDLARYRAELEKAEQLTSYLREMVDALEQVVNLASVAGPPMVQRVSLSTSSQKANTNSMDFSVKGSMPLTTAVLHILRDARGEPLTVNQILQRARDRGARSDAKRPDVLVSNACRDWRKKGQPLDKVAAGTWRWAGSISDDTTDTADHPDESDETLTPRWSSKEIADNRHENVGNRFDLFSRGEAVEFA